MDNLTTYKYNRNFDSFVTLEESVELWDRGMIPKIYFLLHLFPLNLNDVHVFYIE